MDRAKFIANQKGQAVKFHPLTLPGHDEPVYLKEMSVGDVKAQMLKAEDEPKTAAERLSKDQYFIERAIARLMYDENYVLVFDDKDDAQMAELKAVVDASPHGFTELIHNAQNALIAPDKTEVDPKGN